VKTLLDNGAKVDKRAINGATACHQAAFQGHFEVVQYLLKVLILLLSKFRVWESFHFFLFFSLL